MIARDVFSATLAELADIKRRFGALQLEYDHLRLTIQQHGIASGVEADRAIVTSRGVPTQTWQRASAERAACLSILRQSELLGP